MASKVDLLKRERDDLRKLADHWKLQHDEYKGLNARLCAEVDAAAEMLREVKTQNAALRAEVSNLRGTARLHKERADALTAITALQPAPDISTFAASQKPLGAEFEKVWEDNAAALYESQPAPPSHRRREMSERTKAPWIACEHGDYGDYNGNCIVILGDGGNVRTAVVLGFDTRETRANARLIARAPEMAAEIERLRARVEQLEGALKKAKDGLDAGVKQYAARDMHGNVVPGDEQYPWVKAMQIGLDASSAALEGR